MYSSKDLRRLVLPLIIEQILAVTIGIADTVMVSSAGEAAVSGISLIDSINVLLINLFTAIATGGAIVTTQYIGSRQAEKARNSAAQLEVSVLLIALGIVTLTHPGETIGFLCVVYGILVLSDGLFKVQIAVDAKRFGIDRWWAILLAAACAGVLGVLLVLRPGEGAQALTMLLGASLFLDGVMNLLVALLTVKIIRHQRPDVIETDEFEIK